MSSNCASLLEAATTNEDSWKQIDESDGVVIYEKESEAGHITLKGVCVVPHPVANLAQDLYDIDKRAGWDELFSVSTDVDKINDNSRKSHLIIRLGIPFCDDRDLHVLEELEIGEDKAVLCFTSLEDGAKEPQKGMVRAQAYPSGIVIQSKPDRDPALCTVTYLFHIDFKGSLPSVAVKRYLTKILTALNTFATSLDPVESATTASESAADAEKKEGESSGFAGIFATVGATVGGVASSVSSTVGGVATSVSSTVGGVATSVSSTVGGVADSVSTTVGGVATSVSSTVGGVANSVGDTVKGGVDNVSSAAGTATGAAGGIFGKVTSLFGGKSGEEGGEKPSEATETTTTATTSEENPAGDNTTAAATEPPKETPSQ